MRAKNVQEGEDSKKLVKRYFFFSQSSRCQMLQRELLALSLSALPQSLCVQCHISQSCFTLQ